MSQSGAKLKSGSEAAGKTIILGVSGSIAAYKAAEIASALVQKGADVHVIMTAAACNLVGAATFRAITGNPAIINMWDEPQTEEISHVSLSDRADLMLIAPATANIIAKLAVGIADDMLTTSALAVRCPMLIAPAMNPRMYSHKTVAENLGKLRSFGWKIIEPEFGRTACGDVGLGRLADIETIVNTALNALKKSQDLEGVRILVTAGPTREPIDPVRFVSNFSSGKMGYAIAEAASARGADVVLVSGPTGLPVPPAVEVINVETAKEMFEAVMSRIDNAQVFISAAAVADYTPTKRSPQKIKKKNENITIEMCRTEDILKRVGDKKGDRIIVGFAAETENLIENAEKKLMEKNLDLIVGNDISKPKEVFGSDTNKIILIPRKGQPIDLPKMSKREAADALLDYIAANLLKRRRQK